MNFIYITASPAIATYAETCGVQQIMVDLETIGKDARQGHLDTHKSVQTIVDVAPVAAALRSAELMVRINPLGGHSAAEIDAVIAAGVERIMLPMFTGAADVVALDDLVRGRVPVTLLAELPSAVEGIGDYLALLDPRDRVHFGLNDLKIAWGFDFVFEPLARGLLDDAAAACRAAGIPFGIGGLGRAGHGEVPPELILGEHVRLGSSWAILGQAFRGKAPDVASLEAEMDMASELQKLNDAEARLRASVPAAIAENTEAFRHAVEHVTASIRAKVTV